MKRPIFSDGIALGLIRCAFAPIEWAAGKLTGEPAQPLLDMPPLCSSGCTQQNTVKGCPAHDRRTP